MAKGDFLPTSHPRLEDLKSCEDWLAREAPADSPHACTALSTLLGEIEDAPPRHSVYLQILERLRYPVLLAAAEVAKRFAGKPLPLGQDEAAGFLQVTHLWSALLRGYARLLSAALSGRHPELDHSLARLCHRVLVCSGEFVHACLLARREFGTDCWKVMHQAYAAAEARGVAEETVADLSVDSSPMAAFAEILML